MGCCRNRSRFRHSSGQASVGLAVALVLTASCLLALGRLFVVVIGDAAAQSAADATALAGAAGGEVAAAELAAANSAMLVHFEQRGNDTQVMIERRSHRATATAQRGIASWNGHPPEPSPP